MVEYLRRRADRDGQGVVPVRTSQQPLLPPRTSPTSTALRRAGCSCRHVRFSCFPGTWRHRGWSGCASNWRRRHQRRSSFELPPAAGMLRQWSLKLVLLWPMGLNRPLNTLYVLFTSIFFQRGIYYFRNDYWYVRMYIVEHRYTRGDLRLVRRGSWSRVF